MPGTIMGGRKAAATNKLKYGKDFYARIGAMGGKVGRTGGFYANRQLASEAGRKGGLVSRRGLNKAMTKPMRNTAITNAEKLPPYEELETPPHIVTK